MIRFLLIIITLWLGVAHAQDLIVLKNGKELRGVVKELSSTSVGYVDPATAPEVTFIKIADIQYVQYANGKKDYFDDLRTPGQRESSSSPVVIPPTTQPARNQSQYPPREATVYPPQEPVVTPPPAEPIPSVPSSPPVPVYTYSQHANVQHTLTLGANASTGSLTATQLRWYYEDTTGSSIYAGRTLQVAKATLSLDAGYTLTLRERWQLGLSGSYALAGGDYSLMQAGGSLGVQLGQGKVTVSPQIGVVAARQQLVLGTGHPTDTVLFPVMTVTSPEVAITLSQWHTMGTGSLHLAVHLTDAFGLYLRAGAQYALAKAPLEVMVSDGATTDDVQVGLPITPTAFTYNELLNDEKRIYTLPVAPLRIFAGLGLAISF